MNSRRVNGRSSSPVAVGATGVVGTGLAGMGVPDVIVSVVAEPSGAGSAGTGGLALRTGTGRITRLGGGELTRSGA